MTYAHTDNYIRAKQAQHARAQAEAQAAAASRDIAADLAFFLLEKTGSVLGTWAGYMSASEQRALLGHYVGKGQIVINGDEETVCMRVQVCFGLDFDDVKHHTFGDLARGIAK